MTSPVAKALIKRLTEASAAYYNTSNPTMSDAEFDTLTEKLATLIPESHPYWAKVGAEVPTNLSSRVQLPYYVGSLKKIKDDKAFANWVAKSPATSSGQLHVSAKMDGVSCIVIYDGITGGLTAFKRGTGIVGSNITTAVRLIKGIPSSRKVLATDAFKGWKTIIFRGELVVAKTTKVTNPRNYVNGRVSALEPIGAEISNIIDFCPYEIVNLGSTYQMGPVAQFETLKTLFHHLPMQTTTLVSTFKYTDAKELFSSFAAGRYECDGIVLRYDAPYTLPTDSNPNYAIAFKDMSSVTTTTVETTVRSLEWNVGKTDAFSPTVHFDPVSVDGCNIAKATGNNYAWLVSKGINVGAKVVVGRLGNVIPGIVSVTTPSKDPIQLPPNSALDSRQVDLIYTGGDPAIDSNRLVGRIDRVLSLLNLRRYFNTKFQAVAISVGFTDLADFWDAKKLVGKLAMKPENANVITSTLKGTTWSNDPQKVLSLLAAAGDCGEGVGNTKLLIVHNHAPAYFTDVKFDLSTIPFPPGTGTVAISQLITNHAAVVKFVKLFLA